MKKKFSFLLAFCIALTLCSCGKKGKIFSLDDMSGKTVGVMDSVVLPPDADSSLSFVYYGDPIAMAEALKDGRIDCAVADENSVNKMLDYSSGFSTLNDIYGEIDYCMVASEGSAALLSGVDGAIKQLSDDGTLKKIMEGWRQSGGYNYESTVINPSETMKVAVCTASSSNEFYDENGELTGLEIDVLQAVADILGVGLEISDMDSEENMIYMVESGKVALGIGAIVRTDDRDSYVDFSQPYLSTVQLVVVKK